jgi:putative peptidoglycan lipid II flippase
VRPSGRSARLVATGILLSRISGYVRESVIANFLGTSVYSSAFRAALRLPNVLQNLLGEGTLSASFIPVYSKLLARGDEHAAGRLAGAIFALLLAAVAAASLIGVAFAPVFVRIAYWGWEGEVRDATIACVRIIIPMTGILVLSAWALGILNSHRRFLLSYTAPVAWNAAIIAAAFVFGTRAVGLDLILALSWGALIGGALQFLVQLPWVLRLERSLRPAWDTQSEPVRQVLRNAGPAVLGRGVVQLSAYVDQILASFLFVGAFAALGFAQTLWLAPISLFGMSIAAAELPEMAREGDNARSALRARLETALQRIVFFVMPACIGYIVLGDVAVAALYQRGEFEAVDTILVYLILAGYAVGLIASTSTRLYSSAFYALNNTRTPAKIAAVRVALAAALGLPLMLVLERFAVQAGTLDIVANTGDIATVRPLGAVGLAVGSGIAAWVEWTLLRRAIRHETGGLGAGRALYLRLGVAAAVASVAGRLLAGALSELTPLMQAAIVFPAFGVLYVVIAVLMRVPQASDMVRSLRLRR